MEAELEEQSNQILRLEEERRMEEVEKASAKTVKNLNGE